MVFPKNLLSILSPHETREVVSYGTITMIYKSWVWWILRWCGRRSNEAKKTGGTRQKPFVPAKLFQDYCDIICIYVIVIVKVTCARIFRNTWIDIRVSAKMLQNLAQISPINISIGLEIPFTLTDISITITVNINLFRIIEL